MDKLLNLFENPIIMNVAIVISTLIMCFIVKYIVELVFKPVTRKHKKPARCSLGTFFTRRGTSRIVDMNLAENLEIQTQENPKIETPVFHRFIAAIGRFFGARRPAEDPFQTPPPSPSRENRPCPWAPKRNAGRMIRKRMVAGRARVRLDFE